MPRSKKIIFEELDKDVKEVKKKKTTLPKFVEHDAKMITTEKIFMIDDPASIIIGVAMAGETVRVLEQSLDPDNHMTKIRTQATNRTGYVNPRSIL